MSTSLVPHCPVCSKKENLLRCQGCKVMPYCGREHQISDRSSHKSACNAIKKAHNELNRQEQELRSHPGDMSMSANVFEDSVGRFWGIYGTRPYMRARYALAASLLKVHQYDAIKAGFDHIMDLLRLCRGDNMGVRFQAPALFLRLGKDQECYDFMKWWFTTGSQADYDWGDVNLPYLNLNGEDVFESPELFLEQRPNLSYAVALTLLKVKLLLDVKMLESVTVAGEKVPAEILDNIRDQLVTRAVITERKEVMEAQDLEPFIRELVGQIAGLHAVVTKANRFFWQALLDPSQHLSALPSAYSPGSVEEMQLVLNYSYDAWIETPGAIDIVRGLRDS
ncbi:hypothetical protein BGZ60DRAFT_527222 [Tricladium varicosporioides]|nr:hypothetical protein BGZ60DRAFT_527222 [Hymenoscyphus varicosporioides]